MFYTFDHVGKVIFCIFLRSMVNHYSYFQAYKTEIKKLTCSNANEMFYQFDRYGNVNPIFFK